MGGLVTTLVEAGPAVEAAVVRMVPEIAERTPALFRALLARLKTAGAVVGNSVASLLAWVKKEPMNAVLAAVSAGSLGIDLFKGDDTNQKASVAMQPLISGQESFSDHARLMALDSATFSQFKTNIAANQADLQTAADVLRWARGFFGSADAARNGHSMLQAFIEMPYSDVDVGFDTLRV